MYLALCLVAEGLYCALLGDLQGSTPCKESTQIKLISFATFLLRSHLLYPVLGVRQKAAPQSRQTTFRTDAFHDDDDVPKMLFAAAKQASKAR